MFDFIFPTVKNICTLFTFWVKESLRSVDICTWERWIQMRLKKACVVSETSTYSAIDDFIQFSIVENWCWRRVGQKILPRATGSDNGRVI